MRLDSGWSKTLKWRKNKMPLKGSIRKATPKEVEEAKVILEKRKTKMIQAEKPIPTPVNP